MARIAEDQVIEFSLAEVQSVKFRTSRTLLGRLFSTTNFTPSELREGLIEAWRVQGSLRFSVTKYGLFEIVLPSDETRVWVLKRTPWIVKDRILHLRSWTSTITRPVFDDLAIAPFHVQLWNVKEDCCSKQFGRKVAGRKIGQVLEADVFASRETEECFIKVHALIDFTKPLRSQFLAISDELGSFWVNLKYEFLPTFCYLCGRVGHSKPDCVFDPPPGKERFGPHMSTRKLGRKIYMDEEEFPKFHNTSKSVWVNKNIQVKKNESAKNARPREVRHVINDRSVEQVDHQQETHGYMEPQSREQEARPKLSVVGFVRAQKKLSPRKAAPTTRKGSKGRQQVGKRARKVSSNRQQPEDQVEIVLEQSRRRRLILLEESEEEELAGTKAAQSNQPLGNSRIPPKDTSQNGDTVHRARPRLKKGGADCMRDDLRELEDEEVVAPRDDEGQQQIMDSDDEQSTGDQLPFEIKRRSPSGVSIETRKVLTGRVHQVVEAFEAGLVFEQEEDVPINGSRSNFNEYGSNLMDGSVETRKRVLDEVDEEMGDPPTPKKQFVESTDILEKVEEASLEWPPVDK
ncbi:unnamed protein product [Linum trigynum]|uniref:CCHC-type domain-containing protein n=1 Tax=Linum trigynum TaxID=586398 RepID=A0AAV2G8E9_9ROSI